jgi:hypothetical protein
MARLERIALATILLAFACISLIAFSAGRATSQTAADTAAGQIAPAAGKTTAGADQIAPAPGGAANADQIGASSSTTVGASQLSSTMASVSAPPALSRPSQGRDTNVSAIHGHDRCDPAAPTSGQAACDNILDQKGDQFAPPEQATAKTANTDAPADDLVNNIVSSGTGTVVIAPTGK